MRFTLKAAVVLLLALTSVAAAQTPVAPVIDFGVRGGVIVTDSLQDNPSCCRTPFGSPSFSIENPRGTLGPTIGVLLYDRAEVRVEAVRRRFSYSSRFDLVFPPSVDQHSTTSTQGHSWEYPLFGTYHFSHGAVRPFAGGGINLGGNIHSVRDSQFTSTVQSVTTTTSDHRTSNMPATSAYYIVGGFEGRTSYLSIRPELRYRRSPNNSGSGGDVIDKPNQFEFVLGISVHPFRFK